jgi:uncharacterized protein YcbK (DUF882 family)
MRPAHVFFLVIGCGGVSLAAGPAAKPGPIAKATPKPAYGSYVKAWHSPLEGQTAPVDPDGRAMLVLSALNTTERIEVAARSDRGGFAAYDLDRVSKLLREPSSGNQHPVEPRLIDLAYRIQTHFKAQEIRVVSGYRTPRAGGASNHGKGRAIDLVVPGASDDDVAQFARELGFAGVGIYPASGFVHVDVRDRSYFWVDTSGPGKRTRERGILGDLATKSDAAAIVRGEHATPQLAIGWDVDVARDAVTKTAAPVPSLDDDDDL